MSTRLKRLFALFAAVAIGAVLVWWWHLGKESTNDAFVEQDVVYLKPRVSGQLVAVNVSDNQAVKKGQVLARIDPRPFELAVESAQAQVASAEAQVQRAQADLAAFVADLQARESDAAANVEVAQAQVKRQQRSLDTVDAKIEQAHRDVERYQTLAARKQVSQQLLDDARTQLRTLEAERQTTQAAIIVAQRQVTAARTKKATVAAEHKRKAVMEAAVSEARAALRQAQSAVHQAQLNLDWTTIRAPVDGRIGEVQAKTGAMVGPENTLEILVSGEPWVKANFKETQLGQIQPGDRVEIAVDAYPDLPLKGHVASIQPGTGARFGLLPPENATGNFVKVVQRVPVRIDLESVPDGVALSPGLSVVPTVYLDSTTQAQ
ncbi:HlyD family secretion protein [Marinobacteraceae bacterium S3BR75-40.1]